MAKAGQSPLDGIALNCSLCVSFVGIGSCHSRNMHIAISPGLDLCLGFGMLFDNFKIELTAMWISYALPRWGCIKPLK